MHYHNNVIIFSIVSHGNWDEVRVLLREISLQKIENLRIILTLNIHESINLSEFSNLKIQILENSEPLGFGANHNKAFLSNSCNTFVVLNPDLSFANFDINKFLQKLDGLKYGIASPIMLDGNGLYDFNARKFPKLLKLIFGRFKKRVPDYMMNGNTMKVDWIAGSFMAFRADLFAKLNGFDENFFMYMEDIDICRRAHLLGYKILLLTKFNVIHNSKRGSRRNIKLMIHHIKSAFKYFTKEYK